MQRSEREQEKGRVEAWVMNALQQMSKTEHLALNMANAEERQATINEEMRRAGASYVNMLAPNIDNRKLPTARNTKL